jgi:hypothetical protein
MNIFNILIVKINMLGKNFHDSSKNALNKLIIDILGKKRRYDISFLMYNISMQENKQS